jgi:hypothetical protein
MIEWLFRVIWKTGVQLVAIRADPERTGSTKRINSGKKDFRADSFCID